MNKLKVQNLKCGGCANTIVKNLEKIDGISRVSVEVESNTIGFEHTREEEIEAVVRVLKKLGYPTISESNGIKSMARSFVSCGLGRLSK